VAILLVDDEEIIRNTVSRILQQHEFTVIVANDGAEALAVFQEKRAEIVLVLSDVSMPILNGIELALGLLRIDPFAKILLMTGFSVQRTVPSHLRERCGTVKKPFTSAALMECVWERLQRE
jgi:DNA-binding NtrC family response regulator